MENTPLSASSARPMAVGLWLVSATLAVAIVVSTPGRVLLLGFPALVAAVGWALYWRPHVSFSPAGIHLHNVVHTVQVPWPAVESFDLRFGLGVNTRWKRTYTAWALPATRSRGATPRTVQAILDYHLGLKEAGHLDDPRYPDEPPKGTLNIPELAVLFVGLVWAVLGVFDLL